VVDTMPRRGVGERTGSLAASRFALRGAGRRREREAARAVIGAG
jgi:hypothetical protein